MMKMFCAAYVALWVGMAITLVGGIPKYEAFSLWLPLEVLGFLAIPTVLGYMAGREDA